MELAQPSSINLPPHPCNNTLDQGHQAGWQYRTCFKWYTRCHLSFKAATIIMCIKAHDLHDVTRKRATSTWGQGTVQIWTPSSLRYYFTLTIVACGVWYLSQSSGRCGSVIFADADFKAILYPVKNPRFRSSQLRPHLDYGRTARHAFLCARVLCRTLLRSLILFIDEFRS